MTLTIFIIAQSIRTVYINLLHKNIKLSKAQVCNGTVTSALPLRNAVRYSSLVTFLSNQITQIQETIALTPKICYTLPTNKKSHQRMQALGSSQKVTNLKQPNVLRCIRPYSLGFSFLIKEMVKIYNQF